MIKRSHHCGARMLPLTRNRAALATWLVLTMVVIFSVTATSYPLPLVVLGSTSDRYACTGLRIGAQHVLVHSKCVNDKSPLITIEMLDPAATTKTSGSFAISNVTEIPLRRNSSTSTQSVHVITIQEPLPPASLAPVILPLNTPYPEVFDIDRNASLISISTDSRLVLETKEVVYVANSSCDSAVCVLPLDVVKRNAIPESDQWSFLVTFDGSRGMYRLLGIGGDPLTNEDGVWGFSWLPQMLTSSSFTSHGPAGVPTVLSTKKEIMGGKNVDSSSVYSAFVAGLRTSESGETFCGGSLVAPKWILTSAGCKAIHVPTWVTLDTIRASGKPIEAIKVKRTVVHPKYVAGGHSYNFMLLELERASACTPIAYKAKSFVSAALDMVSNHFEVSATAFGYGAEKYKTNRMNERLRSNRVDVLPISECPEELQSKLDVSTMCVHGKICYGDYGGPVVTLAWNEFHQLFGVIGNGYSCNTNKDYAIIGRVNAIITWITKTIKNPK